MHGNWKHGDCDSDQVVWNHVDGGAMGSNCAGQRKRDYQEASAGLVA